MKMGVESSTLSEPPNETYEAYIDRGGARLVSREGDLTTSTMPDIGIGGEASTMTTTVDVRGTGRVGGGGGDRENSAPKTA